MIDDVGERVLEFQLQPRTDPGRAFADLAEHHARSAAPRAADHDRDGTFPTEAIDEMKESGFLAMTIPAAMGGGDVRSVHDLAVAMSRLARGDSSLAIAVNMHLSAALILSMRSREAHAAGDDAAGLDFLLSVVAGGTIVMANFTEPGTDNRHPYATARPDGNGGWILDGLKIFSTLSPVADVFLVSCRVEGGEFDGNRGSAVVLRGSGGMDIRDDWDALGMRASGSGSIRYDNVVIPEGLLTGEQPWGLEGAQSTLFGTLGGIGLIGAFLGIAEHAQVLAAQTAASTTKKPSGLPVGERHGIRALLAQNEIDLAAARASVQRTGALLDDVVSDPASYDIDRLRPISAQYQACKYTVNHGAIAVVDRAMEISGGAGFFAGNPLSRLYRDVRAGPFMQPYAPTEAIEFIGSTLLGRTPTVEG